MAAVLDSAIWTAGQQWGVVYSRLQKRGEIDHFDGKKEMNGKDCSGLENERLKL
ncbi:Hypothetical protein Minf_0974 [Methylacidiphilum infernorum V4]|uniref:Uncharacterized protein n=1 Tax=Methylacidiphilum infernorum (isolate V4) TaxID=481448 RepID=B3DUM6_METI4|nr:Hypothetical protein Minf_0974 [Methylacidiphilum infernorum V4]